MTRKILVLACSIFLVFGFLSLKKLVAQEQDKKTVTIPELIRQIKKTVVFVGEIQAEPNVPVPPEGVLLEDIDPRKIQFRATAFLVNMGRFFHLVTAKHVLEHFTVIESRDGKAVQRLMDDRMYIFFNRKDGKVGFRSLGYVREKNAIKWIFHDDEKVDLAVVPFPISVETDDILTMPVDMFFDTSMLQELYDLFFIAYQPGAKSPKKIAPVIRTGMISLINDDKTFYFDGFAFPGNSGGPVFFKPSAIRFAEKGGFSIGQDPLGFKFIGIVGEYIPYREVALSDQTKRPRIIFEEHTGLTRVWSANFLKDIEESPKFKQQLKALQDKSQQK